MNRTPETLARLESNNIVLRIHQRCLPGAFAPSLLQSNFAETSDFPKWAPFQDKLTLSR